MDAHTVSPIRKLLARHIRWRRFLRGWSQEDLAEASGMHRTYISTLERGRCNPGLDTLERLAGAFEVPIAALLEPSPTDQPGRKGGLAE